MRLPDRLAAVLVELRPDRPDAIAALTALYDDAMHFRDPIQEIDGLPAFLAMNRHLLGRMRSLQWTIRGVTGDDSYAVLEWSMRGKTTFRLPVAVDGTTVVRARNGRIFDHRDYWDLAEMFATPLPFGRRLLYLLRRPLA